MNPYKSITPCLALVTCGLLTGCAREPREAGPDVPADNLVSIKLNIPGNQIPSTRSIAGTGGEAVVEWVDIFVFEPGANSSAPELLAEHARGQSLSQNNNSSDDFTVQFKADLTLNDRASTVIILANVPETVVNTAAVPGNQKQAVLEALTYQSANSTGTAQGWKWKADSGDYSLIPMYGEKALPSGGITAQMKIENIDMVRMLARIDLVNGATGEFTLSEIYLVNHNTAGYIAPAWNTSNGEILSSLPDEPMIPSSATPQLGETNKISYPYSDNGGTGSVGEIYTYEAVKASGGYRETSRIEAVCLVVKGFYEEDGIEYYYRIDFLDLTDASGKKPGETGYVAPTIDQLKYMPVYRNHRYIFTIHAVQGAGYKTFTEALESPAMMPNLTATLLVVDQSGIFDIVWDSHYYLGVGKKLVVDAAGGDAEIKVMTNYPYGWEIDTDQGTNGIEYLDTPTGWILSAAAAAGELKLNLDENPDPDNSRQARIYVRAGGLRHSVLVEQNPLVNSVTIGGPANCYILSPEEELLIPVSRANEGWPGSIADGDVLVGELVWTDNRLGINPASNIAGVGSEGNGPEGYVYVKAGSAEGNAVVAVKVGAEIKWSWHIWVTHDQDIIEAGHPGNTDWMDRNLGAFGNEFIDFSDTRIRGCYFQWGRKDPFPPLNDRYTASGSGIAWATNPTITTVEHTIREPEDWTNNSFSNFAGSNGAKSWDDNGKTVYDPCPYGWKVPLPTQYSSNLTGFNYTVYGRYSNLMGGYYMMAGMRQRENGSSIEEGGGPDYRGNGWYWTATGGSGTSASALTFSEWSAASVNASRDKRYGKLVRCVRDH